MTQVRTAIDWPTVQEEALRDFCRQQPESGLYNRTTYEDAYCRRRRTLDTSPYQMTIQGATLKTGSGPMETDSTYNLHFGAWDPVDARMYRGVPHRPHLNLFDVGPFRLHGEDRREQEEQTRIRELESSRRSKEAPLQYPPFCIHGSKDTEDEKKADCLYDYRDLFNLGPPNTDRPRDAAKRSKSHFDGGGHPPFKSVTNYATDYPAHCPVPRYFYRPPPRLEPPHFRSDTIHREHYAPPPEGFVSAHPSTRLPDSEIEGISGGAPGHPAFDLTQTMVDYQAHDVSGSRCPRRKKPEPFRPPLQRMRGVTETAAEFIRRPRPPGQAAVLQRRKSAVITPMGAESKDKTIYMLDFGGRRSQ